MHPQSFHIQGQRTKDILHIMKLLGRKQIQNTLIYINLKNAVFNDKQNDEFTRRIAHKVEEACRLVEASFTSRTQMDRRFLESENDKYQRHHTEALKH